MVALYSVGMSEFWSDTITILAVATYLTWGFTFAIHALLVLNGNHTAIQWARRWYSEKVFRREIQLFYPMLWFTYLLFELLPAYLGITEEYNRFSSTRMIENAFGEDAP